MDKLFVRPGLCFQFLFNPSPNQPYIMTSILIFDYPVVSYGIRMFVKDFFPGRSILHAATLEEATAHIMNDGVGLVVMDISIRIERDMDIIDLFRELKNDICILIFTEKNKKKYGDLYLNAGPTDSSQNVQATKSTKLSLIIFWGATSVPGMIL
jgi:hypothetical protein